MFVGFDLTPNDKDYIGGGGTYVINTTDNLIKSGHDVHNLIITSNPRRHFKIGLKNCKVIIHPKSTGLIDTYKELIFDFELYRKIRKEINLFEPDIIHFHSLQYTKTLFLSSRYIPKIFTSHSLSSIFPQFDIFYVRGYNDYHGEIDLRLHKIFNMKLRTLIIDHIFLSDKIWKRLFLKKIICPSKHMTLLCRQGGYRNAIKLNYYQNISQITSSKQEYILFVGRLDKSKGVEDLIHAFKKCTLINEKLKLIIVGDGKHRKYLENMSKELNLNKNIFFKGEIKHRDISRFYRNALLVVIPSMGPEGSPIVAYESMNHAKPIIIYNIGGLNELIVHNKNGFIVNKHDIEDLKDKIVYLTKNKKKAKNMGEEGRNILKKNWSSEIHLKQLFRIYEEVRK